MAPKTQFIDSESAPYGKENTFELLVIKQMAHCVSVLSEDMVGGTMKVRMGKMGQQETYIEDVREKIINSVDTFRMLIFGFIKDKHEDEIKKINEAIDKFKAELGEKTMLIKGKGYVKIKNIDMIPQESSIW